MRKNGWPWWIAAAVLVADRVTKMLSGRIPPEGSVLIPGVIGLKYTENTGAAFSMLSGHPWLLGVLSLAVVAGVFFLLRAKKAAPLMRVGLMLMLGGAVGNMIDRFATGYVPDMIDLLFMNFAVFNVADMCLCIGCALAALRLLKGNSVE